MHFLSKCQAAPGPAVTGHPGSELTASWLVLGGPTTWGCFVSQMDFPPCRDRMDPRHG